MTRPPPADLALLVVGVCAVSTSAPLIRLAALPALAVAFWRNGMASVALVPGLVRQRRGVRALTRREVQLMLAAGVLLAAHFATWIPSLSFTSVASSVALVAMQPVWSAALSRLAGQVVPRSAWVGIAVALAGVIALTGVDVSLSRRAAFGDGLALAGGLLAAGYVALGAEVRQTVTTTVYTGICYPTAALILLGACAATGQHLAGYPARAWWYLVALTAGAQLLGHSVFNRVLRTTGPTVVSVAILFEVVGATVLAQWWFGERPHTATVPAALLILAGVFLVVRSAAPAGVEPAG